MINISSLSQTPIYEQIVKQIEEMILKGKLKAEDQLPSIRVMAKELKVGVITVKRAYEELEKEGLVVNLQGRGCFVKELDIAAIRKVNISLIKEQLMDIRGMAAEKGIGQEELLSIILEIYGGK